MTRDEMIKRIRRCNFSAEADIVGATEKARQSVIMIERAGLQVVERGAVEREREACLVQLDKAIALASATRRIYAAAALTLVRANIRARGSKT